MTRIRSFLRATTAALAIAAALPAAAEDYVLAVPRALERDQAARIHQDLLTLVMQITGPGDVVRVLDATGIETIATFEIPGDDRASIPNLRRRALAAPLAAWGRFVKAHHLGTTPEPGQIAAIRLPQLLTHLAAQAFADQNPGTRAVCVLVAGSALYRDPREPGFDMTGGRFPADGLILASQGTSPYGTADRQGLLRGVFVHFLALDEDWQSDLHRLRVNRAWQLFVEAQGGDLPTFTEDPDTAFRRFADCERKPARHFAWDSTRTITAMVTAQRDAAFALDLPAEPPAPEPLPEPVSEEPDETGRFGRVIRIERNAFRPDAGRIGFDEVRLGSLDPVYRPEVYGGDPGGIVVHFGGYFRGQQIGHADDCPVGARRSGCVTGTPTAPLSLDPDAPSVFPAKDRPNPNSPSLSGTPRFNGPITILFDRDVAGVGLFGGHFDNARSTAIRVFDREGNLIGGVVNLGTGMEFLALVTEDGSERIAGLQFSFVGDEPAGFGIDDVRFATRTQLDADRLEALSVRPPR